MTEVQKKTVFEGINLQEEVESAAYNDLSTAQILLIVNEKQSLKLAIWTRQIPDTEKWLLVAKLVSKGEVYQAFASIIRDYIDMTHVRNWIMNEIEPFMDSKGFVIMERWIARHRYVRAPEYSITFKVIM